jgi:hypothetical protein
MHRMYADWIRASLARQAPTKSQAGLARALHRDPSVVSKILAGSRDVKADELPAIARYLGEDPPHVVPAGEVRIEPLPLLDNAALLSTGPEDLRNALSTWQGERFLAEHLSPQAFAYRVLGGCMNRVIPPGSVVVVDGADLNLEDGGRYLVERSGGIYVREYRDRAGVPRLVPRTTEDGHDDLYLPSECRIVGRVRRLMSEL